ncbi:MAG TPA: vitamin B12-dependent ribonucleotide reductase [Spirochaetota bacterium]
MASEKFTWQDLSVPADKKVAITENGRVVLERRYFAKNEKGERIEDAHGMFSRIAKYVAFADLSYGASQSDANTTASDFFSVMADLDFIPNSPTLMNAGRPLGQLSACFVLPVEDSIDRIFDSVKNMALIHKSGGGTGFSFSRLRPKNDVVQTTAGVSSGPVSFISIFNAATETIKQGGTRRGANMAILNVDHPDILEFITAKEDTTALTNFNISVGITDEFMRAVDADTDYPLRNPRTGVIVERLSARHVFNLIIKMAWLTGEPGIVFLDRINEKNVIREVGLVESTNPCGEQPLLPYESCNLGSINLSHMIDLSKGKPRIDFDKLARTIHISVHFLDNVIDMNQYPLKEIDQNTKANRKIGLGVMGFADMLIRLGVPYNSEEGIECAEKVMSFIQEHADMESAILAEKRGTFPNFDRSDYAKENRKLRNATRTTIAPTGTISIIANASSGIEPLFALAYTRNVMDGTKLLEVNPLFKEVMKERGLLTEQLMERIAAAGSVHYLDEIPEDIKKVFVTSHDISPEWHIRMQGAFQKYTDNAVSKTVNFPSTATEEEIEKVYRLAFDLGCKGVTVYRDGSREGQVLQINAKKEEKKVEAVEEVPASRYLTPKKRGELTWGVTRKIATGCGPLYVTMNRDENGLFEVFAVMGKSGGCAASQTEGISRLISLGLRCGIDPDQIIKQIKGVRCPNQAWEKGGRVYSCADAIAKALEKYLHVDTHAPDSGTEIAKSLAETNGKGGEFTMVGVCPECHGPLEHESGCSVCRSCGFSRCG